MLISHMPEKSICAGDITYISLHYFTSKKGSCCMKRLLALLLAFAILVTSIGGAAADTLRLPESLKQIEEESFALAASAEEVDVPFGTETIGSRAFAGSGLKKIYLPPTVRYIAPDAFDEGELTIVTPYGSYAKTFADEHGFAWEDGGPHYKLDMLESTQNLGQTEITGSLILEIEEIPRLSTEGITDEAQLAEINEMNQAFAEYEELEKQYAAEIDALTDALSSLADEMSKISVTEREDQISVSLGGAQYTLSGDAIRSIGSDCQIVSTEMTEDGANVITEVTSGGRTYYMINSANGTIVSSSREGAISTQTRMAARGVTASAIIKAVEEGVGEVQKIVSAADACISMARSKAEVMVQKAEDQIKKLGNGNGATLKDIRAAKNRLKIAENTLSGVKYFCKCWSALCFPSNVYSILSDINKYNELGTISAHGHPIPGIAADDLRMSTILQMNHDISTAQYMLACDAILNLLDMVGSFVEIIKTAVKFIPALTAHVIVLEVLFDAAMYFAQFILSGRGEQYYNQATEADKKLHSYVYGYITDEETKEPVPNAGVTNGSAATISKEDGSYQLYLFPGETNSLLIRAKGYEDNGVVVTLNPNDREQRDIELKPVADGATVFGVVTNRGTGALLEGVQVTCADRQVITGADGSFRIEGLEPGERTISFYKTGYTRWSETFTLEEDQQLELNIALDASYIIRTREELEAVANDLMGNYTLGNSIDLGDEPWTPLPWFSGTFDGAGYSINGMKINAAAGDYAGLFSGLYNGHVYNLHLYGVNVDISCEEGFMAIGSFCGALNNGSSLTNCSVSGTVRATSTSGNQNLFVGGLAGFSDHGYITDCFSDANVTAVTPNNAHAGGLAGILKSGEARDSKAVGNVSVIQSGSNSGATLKAFGTLYSDATLADNCNATGVVTAQSTNGTAFAHGVARSKNSVNGAAVSAETENGNATAIGYMGGENGVNGEAVLATASGTGNATAVGLENVNGGRNSGSVTARAISGNASAHGCQNAGNDVTNSGSVIAESTGGEATATGLRGQGSGCTNSGSVFVSSVTNQALAIGVYGCSGSQNTGSVTVVSGKGKAIGQGITACTDSTNYGNVDVTYEGVDNKNGQLSAQGLNGCTNCTNIGNVTGTVKASTTSCTVTGVSGGSGNVNNGAITATSQSGPANARGIYSSNSQNYGAIYAYTSANTNNDYSVATAYGVGSGYTNSFNGGKVTAASENGTAYAYGTGGSRGCSSSGTVSATSNYFVTGTDGNGTAWGEVGKAFAYNSTSVQATVAGHSASAAGGNTMNLYFFYASSGCNDHRGMERQFVSYEQGKEPGYLDGCFIHVGVADSDAE